MSNKTWYVEATGHTNEVIAVESRAEIPALKTHEGVLCQDGVKRDFWECDYRFVAKLVKNQAAMQITFKVFYREGKYGPVKLWPFLKKKRLTLAKALEKGGVKRGVAHAGAT